MTISVLVPDDNGVAALSGVDGVVPVRYQAGQDWPADAASAQVLVPGFLARDDVPRLLAGLPKLEYVQLLSAGAENWIGRLPEHVLLSTCRGAHGGSTAEWVVGGLLAVYRDFPRLIAAHARQEWDFHSTDTLQDKRVLIVGAGDLGDQLARRLAPFDVARVTLVGRRARDGVHSVAELPGLLGEHDVVVLMVPLTSQTTGMVDAAFLAAMPDGAILVNAARGPVVDTDALVAELAGGRLRAVLDVTDPEPLPPGHPLWTVQGLFLTPHVGGSCRGGARRAWRVAASEIARYAAGELPRNLVRGEY
ncbi:MAG TPA: 2-hydroxyacid dehydrogenase [Pseudonocardiaceae bacterium]|nr:2-hydroxyacid dehydrogenase [Pseudonocardiaceae bacterium]